MYQYVSGNPVRFVDPDGLDEEEVADQKLWICKRPIQGWMGNFADHHYVCCDVANGRCYSHDENGKIKEGEDIPEEGGKSGTCKKKSVTKTEKEKKCPSDGT